MHLQSLSISLTMQFKLLSVLALASVALASPTIEERQSCSEADRFGSIELSKTQIAPGDASVHVHCS